MAPTVHKNVFLSFMCSPIVLTTLLPKRDFPRQTDLFRVTRRLNETAGFLTHVTLLLVNHHFRYAQPHTHALRTLKDLKKEMTRAVEKKNCQFIHLVKGSQSHLNDHFGCFKWGNWKRSFLWSHKHRETKCKKLEASHFAWPLLL